MSDGPAIRAIGDDDRLWRRVSRDKLDKHTGEVTFRAYVLPRMKPYRPDPEISVYLAAISNPDEVAVAPGTGHIQGLGELVAGMVRHPDVDPPVAFGLRHTPNDELPVNHAHCTIDGVATLTHCAILAKLTTVIRNPS